MTAPRDIGVEQNGDQWAMLCWSPPPSGTPLGYIVYLTSTTDFMPRVSSQRNVSKEELGRRADRICTSLTDLESWSDFEARIAGWNFQEIGMISDVITFDTKVNSKLVSRNMYHTLITDRAINNYSYTLVRKLITKPYLYNSILRKKKSKFYHTLAC